MHGGWTKKPNFLVADEGKSRAMLGVAEAGFHASAFACLEGAGVEWVKVAHSCFFVACHGWLEAAEEIVVVARFLW